MRLYNIKNFLLKAIIVTLPFGDWPLLPYEYTDLNFMLMYAYLIASFGAFRKSFSLQLFNQYALPLLAMWIIMVYMYYEYPVFVMTSAESILRQLIFYIAFFTFALKDTVMMARSNQRLGLYLLIAVTGLLLAFFGGFSTVKISTGRISLVGVNSNLVAMYCAVGVLLVLDSLINQNGFTRAKWVRYSSIFMLIGFFIVIGLTGSRGGLLILGVALVVYFLSLTRLSAIKIVSVSAIGVALLMAIWEVASTSIIADRLHDIEDDMRLTVIWPIVLELIEQYPFFGVGLAETQLRIFHATGIMIATHNEYLKIASGSGLIGLGLFLLVLMRFLRNAFLMRKSTGSGLYIALWVVIVLFLGKGGGAIQLLFTWVMFLMFVAPPSVMPSSCFAYQSRDRLCIQRTLSSYTRPI